MAQTLKLLVLSQLIILMARIIKGQVSPCETIDWNSNRSELLIENCMDGPPTNELLDILSNGAQDIRLITISNAGLDHENNITWICEHTNLHYLDLSDNRLYDIPKCFTNLTSLVEIDLRNNYLKGIPLEMWYFPNLTILNLGLNLIYGLDARIWLQIDTNSLVVLNLTHNQLTSIPRTVEDWSFSTLQAFDISYNFFQCNCTETWLKEWVLTNKRYLTNYERIMCMNSATKTAKRITDTDDKEFVCPSTTSSYHKTLRELLFAVIFVLIVLPTASLGTMYCIYKKRLAIFRARHWHPFDVDNCRKETMYQDAFIVSAPSLHRWVESKIETFLTERDFVISTMKTVSSPQLNSVVRESKRTICIISHDFLKDLDCMQALHETVNRDIRHQRQRTILVKYEEQATKEALEQLKKPPKDLNIPNPASEHFYSDLLYWLPTETMGGKTRNYQVNVQDTIPLQEVEMD